MNVGNIAYAGKSGTSTSYGNTTVDREVILNGATWPDWSQAGPGVSVLDGTLRIGTYSLNCIIDNVIDSTHAQLDSQFLSLDRLSHRPRVLTWPGKISAPARLRRRAL